LLPAGCITTCECSAVMHWTTSLWVFPLTFESLCLESLFLVSGYTFRIFRSALYMKSSGQGQGHGNKKAWNLILPPLLWQTWCYLAAVAVTASPWFQSFRVRCYLPAATRVAGGVCTPQIGDPQAASCVCADFKFPIHQGTVKGQSMSVYLVRGCSWKAMFYSGCK